VGEHREGDVAVPGVVAAHLVVVEADFVERYAGDVADNLNPVGRLYCSASTLICTPASLSQDVGTALGAQAGEARLRAMARRSRDHLVPPAAETPFNLVLEARP
jgi:hypothetical protein